jgi:hypothetical protein
MSDSMGDGTIAESPGGKLDVNVDMEKVAGTGIEEPPNVKQPFGAVWIVIACGFALMSDGKALVIIAISHRRLS